MSFLRLLLLLPCFLFGQVNAATISIESAPAGIGVGDIFSLDIIGSEFASNPDGGGLNLYFDETIINVLSVSIDEVVWDFGATGISQGVIDNALGTVNGIMVNAWSDVGTSFTVATIEFQAVAEGFSGLTMNELKSNPWASGGNPINPDYVASSVTVGAVIPVPAAVWLFGSGLIGLTAAARRRTINGKC